METLNIALLQLLPVGDGTTLSAQREKGLAAVHTAKKLGADIALFPELWSCGYTIPENADDLQRLSVAPDGDFVRSFATAAQELEIAVAITFLEQTTGAPRNTVALFDRHGKRVLLYAKVHTCDFGDEARLSAGDDFYVCDLDTVHGVVKVGAMICYDREFPESARILMLKGAELVLVPNACPMEINRLSQLRARAYENMLAVATCNYADGKPDCNGGSSVFDGVAYLPTLASSRDTCLFQADGREGVFVVELNLAQLREYRAREVHGNAYRHPQKYALLTDRRREPPFLRRDYRE